MKFTFKATLLALIFASAINWIHATPFYDGKFLSQIQDTLLIKQDSCHVTVNVSFIVDKKGKLGRVKIIQTVSDSCSIELIESCEAEALRAVKNLPDWSPGVKDGKPVAVQYNIPIRFTMPNEKTDENK